MLVIFRHIVGGVEEREKNADFLIGAIIQNEDEIEPFLKEGTNFTLTLDLWNN